MKATGKHIIFVFTLLALATSAHAQSPREQLQQLVEQLQKTPADAGLRERIIKLAVEIKPALAIPPEAKRPFVMAGTYHKEAKKPADLVLAIDAYQEALKVAPWWGDAYYNLSFSLESAGRLDEAKAALNLYLLTKPNDSEEAQNRLYVLDAKKNLAAKQRAESSVESVFCPWYGSNTEGTMISVDQGSSALTYFERGADGTRKPAIISRANVSESHISWIQNETFPGQTRLTAVSYNLNRASGVLEYRYNAASGEARVNRLNCGKVKL
jgi:tetratricopeptide (TPR) repeat protein